MYLDRGASNRIAIADESGAWTYGELRSAVEIAAAALGRLDGRRVGLVAERTKEFVAALLGVFHAGGIAVPLSPRSPPSEIAYQLTDASVSTVVADPPFVSEAPNISTAELFSRAPSSRLAGLRSGGPALMLYTSGTTGRPKGVVHTHSSLVAQVDVLYRAWEWSEHDRLLHVLPLEHVHGLVNGALGALWAGARLDLRPSFDASDVWAQFASRGPSVFYAVPTIYHKLTDAWERQDAATRSEWSRGAGALRLAVSGSAALPPALWTRWRELSGQAILERYGMTEIGMAISNPYRGERRRGTVGIPLPGVEVRLVSDEIWVKSRMLFREYWGRPEATKESIRDGFFRTGDVAEVLDGYYSIRGRLSVDIIKSGGHKISALEIEQVLSEHPSVREAAVVGVPDPEWGEIVAACVVIKPGAALSMDDVRAFCRERLASYKLPRRLEVLPELPRNAMGKVTKPELLRRL